MSVTLVAGCGSSTPATPGSGGAGSGGSGSGGSGSGGSGSGGAAGSDASGTGGVVMGTGGNGGNVQPDGGTDVAMMPIPGTCQPPVDIEKPYEKLSQTGCMDPQNPTKMASRVFAYEVNSPLWSDNAAKSRGMALPPGGKIHVKNCANVNASTLKEGDECCVVDPNNYPNCLPPADDGKWVFPIGTVMVKNFMFDTKLVETRLFMRTAAKVWVGYSYQWNEAQTEATIVSPDRLTNVAFNTGMRTVMWNYPSRKDCLICHNDKAGSILGPETVQMNRVVMGETVNQIDKLAALNAFEVAPTKPYKAALVAPYAIPGQLVGPPPSATTEDKTLSYLHANCSYCHRPDGIFYNIDFRHDVTLKGRNICNAMPTKGDIGVAGSLDLVPGMPGMSVMYLRMNSAVDKTRMPQIGTVVVDTQGTKLISDWITTVVKACPP